MLLVVHASIAVTSLIYTSLLYFSPSRFKLNMAYGLVGFTLLSGTYLVISMNARLLSSCITGLIYLLAVAFGILAAKHRLASQTAKSKQ